MNRRSFLQTSLAGLVPAASAGQGQAGAQAPERPNIIWVFGDQLRAQALGCNGDPNARTPNLDRAERLGINFTSNISGFPLCCPFRGSLLTSRYPHHCVPGHEYPLPEGQQTIADIFNTNGYDTAYFGKWHLGGFHESQGRAAFFITDPKRRGGFRSWTGYENNNSQYDCWVHGGEGKDAFHYRLPGYESDALTDLLIGYVKGRTKDPKPFFAVLSVQPPHDPNVAPAQYMAHFNQQKLELRANVAQVPRVEERARRELAGYYAQIENLDWNYGRILQALTDNGQLANTHIFFFADHGDMMGSHGMFRKVNPYDESIRTPMIITGGQATYGPWRTGRIPALLNHVDIAPTTLGLCHIKKPDWMEGSSYAHYRLAGLPAASEPDSAYLQNVVATGHPDSINVPYRGVVTKDGWKYVCLPNQSFMMFNLNEDPYEEANLAMNNAFRAERLKLIARLKQWLADTGDTFAIPDA